MNWWRVFLTMVLVNGTPAFAAKSVGSYQSSVVTKGFIWNVPGYTWYDCRAGEPDFAAKTEEDQIALRRYNEPGVQQACQSKGALLNGGTDVDLVLENGKPLVKTIPVKIGSKMSPKRFYRIRNPETEMEGWMSSDYLSDPRAKEFAAPSLPVSPKKTNPAEPCPPEAVTTKRSRENREQVEDLRRDSAELAEATAKIAMGASKSDAEFAHFACLYRDGHVSHDQLIKILPEVKRTALAAEKAFGIPAPILRCAMLVESGFNGAAKSEKNAYGYAQFLAGTVLEISKASQKAPYSEPWQNYRQLERNVSLSANAVRDHSTIASSMGAMALYLKQLQQEYVRTSCKDCDVTDGSFSRKEVYLLITGYNGGPEQITRAASKNPAQMLVAYPPPEQTRGYILQMEKCLEGGFESSFRQTPKQLASNARKKKEIARLTAAQKRQREMTAATPGAKKSPAQKKAELALSSAKEELLDEVAAANGYENELREKECRSL